MAARSGRDDVAATDRRWLGVTVVVFLGSLAFLWAAYRLYAATAPHPWAHAALHRLERRGWLAEEWGVTDTGREAKYYSLTSDGRAHLRAESKRWARFSSAVSRALTTAST